MPEMEDLVFRYQAFLTVTDKGKPLDAEWGPDEYCTAVNIVNPAFTIGGTDANGVDVLYGSAASQFNYIAPGGTSGIVGVKSLGELYVKARVGGETVRIVIDVYGKREDE